MTAGAIPQFASLDQYLEASLRKYDACLDVLETDLAVDGVEATLRFHHVRFDSNGQPKFADLANCLADHLVEYSFSARRRQDPQKSHEHSKLRREARDLLRKHLTGGE